ncbi:CDP-glucose 4,6-dehydratase [Undibacterium sp. Di24W]|uniref:CDP-glucose 4,6-dehydratase n=1 Tax=Undibacterium sp. Di24W TaxID=3413033 RepID=UPI003BEFE344
MNQTIPNADFWSGRRVLLTGHTGFKGAWLALVLRSLGADVVGLALPPTTEPNLYGALGLQGKMPEYLGDLRNAKWVASVIESVCPEIVLHLAAQALVRPSYEDPLTTYATNFMGTAHVLDALRTPKTLRVALMVTTDKVYRNLERIEPYAESAELGGYDPYSASKAASEILIASYRQSFLQAQGVCVMSARAGNVIGGGDWSADRLIPDAVRAWNRSEVVKIRRPDAVRPWQHVLEPVCAYLILAQKACQHPEKMARSWNIGPDGVASVRDVMVLAQNAFGFGDVEFASSIDGPHEAGFLSLDTSLVRDEIGIAPRWDLSTAVNKTMNWYRDFHDGADASYLCSRDWKAYSENDA